MRRKENREKEIPSHGLLQTLICKTDYSTNMEMYVLFWQQAFEES